MNLAQHIPVVQATKTLTKEHRKVIFDQQNQLSVLQRFNNTDKAVEHVRGQAFDLGLKLTVDGYAIPKMGAVFDGMPVTTTEHARELADKIGFAIMPFEYLSNAFRPDYADAQRIDVLDKRFDLWVMAPVTAYSLARHLKTKDKPIHVPQDVAQAFMALSMSVPVFRAMQTQLDDLREHIRDHRDRLGNLEQEVKALAVRVDELAVSAARERAQRNAEAAEAKKREAEILDWYRNGSDPLVLALPQGKTIRDNSIAFIGPCWGELPACVAKALALKPLKALPKKVK